MITKKTLKKKISIIICVFLLFLSTAGSVEGGQKYNPHTRQWVTVPDSWTTQYNPNNRTWTYQPYRAQTIYNPHNRTWDWDSGHNPKKLPTYNSPYRR